MENSRLLPQKHQNEIFEASGFCSLCRRLVSRSFPKRVLVSDEEMSRIMDQGRVQLEPLPHVHVFWIDRNLCVRRVEGVKISDDEPKTQAWITSGALKRKQEGNVILLGDNFTSGFNNIRGFLVRNGSSIIEAMPRILDNSLITKYSTDQDISVSVLPDKKSDLSNLSDWVKLLVKAIESIQVDLDSDSIWLVLSYADTSATRIPVATDEKILPLLLTSKHIVVTLQPEIKSLIESFSNELGVDLSSVEQSFSFENLYCEIVDMIRRVGISMTFRVFFRLFNSKMLKVEPLS
jgi:hypothetical protein